jgi:hypothetical protein
MDLLPLELIGETLFQLSEMKDYVGLGRCRMVCITWKALIDMDEHRLFKPAPYVPYLRWYYRRSFGRKQLEDIVHVAFAGHSMEAIRNMEENNIPNVFNSHYTKVDCLQKNSLAIYKAFETLLGTPRAKDLFSIKWYHGRATLIRNIVFEVLCLTELERELHDDSIHIRFMTVVLHMNVRSLNTLLIQMVKAFL